MQTKNDAPPGEGVSSPTVKQLNTTRQRKTIHIRDWDIRAYRLFSDRVFYDYAGPHDVYHDDSVNCRYWGHVSTNEILAAGGHRDGRRLDSDVPDGWITYVEAWRWSWEDDTVALGRATKRFHPDGDFIRAETPRMSTAYLIFDHPEFFTYGLRPQLLLRGKEKPTWYHINLNDTKEPVEGESNLTENEYICTECYYEKQLVKPITLQAGWPTQRMPYRGCCAECKSERPDHDGLEALFA